MRNSFVTREISHFTIFARSEHGNQNCGSTCSEATAPREQQVAPVRNKIHRLPISKTTVCSCIDYVANTAHHHVVDGFEGGQALAHERQTGRGSRAFDDGDWGWGRAYIIQVQRWVLRDVVWRPTGFRTKFQFSFYLGETGEVLRQFYVERLQRMQRLQRLR